MDDPPLTFLDDAGPGSESEPAPDADSADLLVIDDDDRYSRLRLISWWRQERLAAARVLVVGAGALGNEVLKNLALLGVGSVYVIDLDAIEGNLRRFRQEISPATRLMAVVKANGYGHGAVMIARTALAAGATDLAVATGAGQIKIGSVRNAERAAKYNQLLRIEEDAAVGFAGVRGIAGFE